MIDVFDPDTWRADPYHPHYPDVTKDYFARLMAVAPEMADYRRLMCYKYPDSREIKRTVKA